MSEADDTRRAVHDAISALLDDGEIAVSWALTIDVAGPDDTRYLAHRSGGGIDGDEHPTVWSALGMLRAAVQVAEDQLRDCTYTPDDEDEDEQ